MDTHSLKYSFLQLGKISILVCCKLIIKIHLKQDLGPNVSLLLKIQQLVPIFVINI
jgi:hypothetical protein